VVLSIVEEASCESVGGVSDVSVVPVEASSGVDEASVSPGSVEVADGSGVWVPVSGVLVE